MQIPEMVLFKFTHCDLWIILYHSFCEFLMIENRNFIFFAGTGVYFRIILQFSASKY